MPNDDNKYARVHSSYLHSPLCKTTVKKLVRNTVAAIKKSGVRFDAIAFTGVSGSLVAPIVAFKLNKYPLVVRKKDDPSHYCLKWDISPPMPAFAEGVNLVEGMKNVGNYIIIDDFISSGDTMRRIVAMMQTYRPGSTCVGAFLYGRTGDAGDWGSRLIGAPLYGTMYDSA